MSRTADTGLLAAALLLAAGCLSPGADEAPGAAVVPWAHLRLVAVGDEGPAAAWRAEVHVEPGDGQSFVMRCVRGPDGRPEPALIELAVRWQDFPGDRPESWGRSSLSTTRWEGEALAEPAGPLVIAVDVELPPPGEILARRVHIEGRLIGVEFVRGELRTGGTIVPMLAAVSDARATGDPRALETCLRSGSARGIFTSAAAAPAADRAPVTTRLVQALDETSGPARDAVCASLHYLTGEAHGRDAARWRSWWDRVRPNP